MVNPKVKEKRGGEGVESVAEGALPPVDGVTVLAQFARQKEERMPVRPLFSPKTERFSHDPGGFVTFN